MFGSGISFTGLGSGIDTASLVERLVQLEGLRKAQLESKKDIAGDKQKAIGKLETLVKALKTKAQGLSETSEFLKLKGSVSREGVLSFDVSSEAAQGSHTIEIQQLAAFDRWAFDSVTDPDVDLATGAGQQITFTAGGNTYAVTVDPSASSLTEIAGAINDAAEADVSASVVNVGTDSAPSWKLVLASKQSGEAGRVTGLASSIAGLTIDGTAPLPGETTPVSANHLAVGLNAVALVDGLLVERDTNEFEGVLPGVSFTAQSADPGNPVDISIEPDNAAIKVALKGLVDAYNEVVRYVNEQNTYSEDDGAGGALFGDSAISIVRSRIRSAIFDVPLADVLADAEGYSTLGLVGLEVQKDGLITIDESTLDEKITANVGALADLFADDDGESGTDSGLAARLESTIASLVDRGVGPNGEALKSLFGAKNESLSATISELDKRISEEEYRLDKYEEALRIRFANLENLMAQLNSQGSALGALGS